VTISGLLLAAGESTRMGTLKALLVWEGTTLLEYQVAQLRGVCSEVVVVLGHEAPRLRALLGDDPHPSPPPKGEGASLPSSSPLPPSGDADSPLPLGEAGRECARVRVVLNPDYRSGKTSSIRAGVAALSPTASSVLILGVDQPRPRDLLAHLIGRHEAAGALLSVPTHAGRRGHPPIFARALFPELLALAEEREGLREVFRAHADEVLTIPVESPLILVNLNRPEDYAAARA
jgi:molybdenum cofactor cytidylyltransferase